MPSEDRELTAKLKARKVRKPRMRTEPKAKLYVLARSEPTGDDAGALAAAQTRIDDLVAAVLGDAEAQARAVMEPLLS